MVTIGCACGKNQEQAMEQRKKYLMRVSLFIFLFSTVNKTLSDSPQPLPAGKHFVLVHGACHGACHGAWSWYKLVALLRSSGHKVTALDLAASGIDPKQVDGLRSISDYFWPLMNFMASLPSYERVILVGHSLGGLAISQAMESFPKKISVAVFVTALMPGPSLNISTLNQEDLTLATMLMRPIRLYSEEDMSKELILSSQKYGSVSRVYIISDEDNVTKKDFQGWMIEKNLPDGVEVITGSDHMVMMSKPKKLWVHLQGIAEKYS